VLDKSPGGRHHLAAPHALQLRKPCIGERAGKGFRLAVFKHSLPNRLNPEKGRGNVPLILVFTATSSLSICRQFACSDKQALFSL